MSLGLRPLGVDPIAILPLAQSGITGTATLFMASETYVSLPGDTDANRHYRGILDQPLRLNRSVIGPDTPAGRFGFATGELEALNGDGFLDALLGSAGFDGRQIVVKAVARGTSLDQARTVFQSVMALVSADLDVARFDLRSRDFLLRQSLQSERFTGAGGAEGGDDLKDKLKPAAFGAPKGVTPVYLGLIGGKHSYMVSGGDVLPIADVPAFYDKGEALTKVGSAPVAGEYSVDTATGIVTIGGTVPSLPTCNIDGYAPDGDFKQSTADIVLEVLDLAGLSNTRIDFTSFSNLNSDQPAPVELWIGTAETSALRVVATLLRGVTAWGDFNRLDSFAVGQLKEPSSVIRAVFDATNLLDIERLTPPAVMNPPAWRHEVAYGFNYTVSADVSILATEDQRSFMAEPWRIAAASNGAIAVKHVGSQTFFTPGRFVAEADAQTEATRLSLLYENKAIYRLSTMDVAPELDIGQSVQVTAPRFGLERRRATILAQSIDLRSGEVDLEVLT